MAKMDRENTIGSVSQFDRDYASVLAKILRAEPMVNARTGKRVKAIHGVHFRTSEFPILHLRDIRPLWSCVEAVWFLSGQCSVGFMRRFGFNNWDAFTDEDGNVLSATGHRWRKAFDVDQISVLMDKLENDPTSRQGVMISWVPQVDLVNPGPNAPCIIAWHVEILDRRLHMSVMQRSADMFFGLPHDILGFRIVQELMAGALGVKPGVMSYHVSNAHLYEDQWYPGLVMISRAARDYNSPADFSFRTGKAEWNEALSGDIGLPALLHRRLLSWYSPWPAIRGPRLVK